MDNFGKMDCGTNIKRIRIKHKLSQEQFAEIIGKSPSTLHAYENNTVNPPLNVLLTIGNIFHISLGSLMGLDDLKQRKESMDAVRKKLNLGTEASLTDSDASLEDLKKIYNYLTGMTGETDDE